MKQIDILDSTLRDGAQGEGISFSVEDKLNIVRALDALGVKYIEAGNPGSNPKDLEFFRLAGELELQHSTLAAFGSTRRKGIAAAEDANIQALLSANTPTVVIFGKCWDLHVTHVLGTTLEENKKMIEDTVAYLKAQGKEVLFDAEHFFDGYTANPEYALECIEAAVLGGADGVVLCDTNGGSFPHTIAEVTRRVTDSFMVKVGIHCHNDTGMAVANSIMAVQAGARHVQGTYIGFGERCGNANLSTIIPNLQVKEGYVCIPVDNIHLLTSTARYLSGIANVILPNTEPFVGSSAFAHKAGMHADGVSKVSQSFEHIDPTVVGNERRFLMSEQAGRTAVLKKINELDPTITRDDPATLDIIKSLKELEQFGYQFEGAEGSFELFLRKHLNRHRTFFELVSYKIIGEQPVIEELSCTAAIKVRVDGQLQLSAAEGDGPVHALDKALRTALEVFYPALSRVQLIDYKVRVMEPQAATAAKVRVLIQSRDERELWTTVGVSTDIIQASWIALVDSIEFKLIREAEKGG